MQTRLYNFTLKSCPCDWCDGKLSSLHYGHPGWKRKLRFNGLTLAIQELFHDARDGDTLVVSLYRRRGAARFRKMHTTQSALPPKDFAFYKLADLQLAMCDHELKRIFRRIPREFYVTLKKARHEPN